MIELPIGKINYKIPCQKSEEEHLSKLAQSLNKRLNRLATKFEDVDEKTLLAIAALSLEGEIKESLELENQKLSTSAEEVAESVSQTMENIADYIEKLTKRIQKY